MQDIIDRIIKYSNNFQIHDSPVIRGVLIELLHTLNSVTAFEKPEKTNQTVKKIIAYLNDNYTNDVDLDQVAEKFFISKFHLCRVFKKATGLTLQEYVRRKRLTLALELKRQGITLSEAASQSGFHDYTSFYRYYKKRYKESPKKQRSNTMKKFINYAHRGASTYFPENTMVSFRNGLDMGANGIETDVQITKDGVLVLFHDDTLDRVTGKTGCIADYTYNELLEFDVKNGELTGKIPTFEEFLKKFCDKDITFAIELKVKGVAKQTAEMIYKYGVQDKVIITSFIYDAIIEMKEVAPSLRRGYLFYSLDEKTTKEIEDLGLYEICPNGKLVTKEQVEEYHQKGYSVRAWGISDQQVMIDTYNKGVDGMTVNFPDKLTELLKK